jgi:hypothetical protein
MLHTRRSRLCLAKTPFERPVYRSYHTRISTREISLSCPKIPRSLQASLTGNRRQWSRHIYSPPKLPTLQRSYQNRMLMRIRLKVKLSKILQPTWTFASRPCQSCRRYVPSSVKHLNWMTLCSNFYQRRATDGWTTPTLSGQCFQTSNKNGRSSGCLEKASIRRPKRRPQHWKLGWIGDKAHNGFKNFSHDSLDVTTTAGSQRIAGTKSPAVSPDLPQLR